MKKLLILLFVSGVFSIIASGQSVYDLSFTNIDGGSVSLSTYEGKRILFIIAPVSAADSLRLDEIKTFQQRYGKDTLAIIGIMSNEDGYSAGNNTAIKNLYQTREIEIVLTGGMYTKKSAGANQSSLLQWLTEKDQNRRFDFDANGIGHKFFVSKGGKIFGSLLPNTSLADPVCDWMMHREQ
jgi:glutathione peroxidase